MDGSGSKMAATVLAAVMETVQVAPLAESHPLQVESTDPASGVAVNCTVDPSLAVAVQVAPHSTPLPSTEPPPPPAFCSESVNKTAGALPPLALPPPQDAQVVRTAARARYDAT